jgi:hypothetical protein
MPDSSMTTTPSAVCEDSPTLPSSETAYRVWKGEPVAPLLLLRDLAFRGLLIALGMYVAGFRKKVLQSALAGSASIEFFVLSYEGIRQYRLKRRLARSQLLEAVAPPAGGLQRPAAQLVAPQDPGPAIDALSSDWLGRMGVTSISDQSTTLPDGGRVGWIAVFVDGDPEPVRRGMPTTAAGRPVVVWQSAGSRRAA